MHHGRRAEVITFAARLYNQLVPRPPYPAITTVSGLRTTASAHWSWKTPVGARGWGFPILQYQKTPFGGPKTANPTNADSLLATGGASRSRETNWLQARRGDAGAKNVTIWPSLTGWTPRKIALQTTPWRQKRPPSILSNRSDGNSGGFLADAASPGWITADGYGISRGLSARKASRNKVALPVQSSAPPGIVHTT